MEFENNATAWMIRRDGEAFPCIQHIYGSPDDIEETLYAAEWLYKSTLKESTKECALRLMLSYGKSLNAHRNPVRSLLLEIKKKPYRFLDYNFIMSIGNEINSVYEGNVEALNKEVVYYLSQEFMRARYGGMYNTVKGNRDMYFRISSDKFDWFPIINAFVEKHSEKIDTLTVVRDEESTGENWFYTDENSIAYDKMPLK